MSALSKIEPAQTAAAVGVSWARGASWCVAAAGGFRVGFQSLTADSSASRNAECLSAASASPFGVIMSRFKVRQLRSRRDWAGSGRS
jgi:hypothetical protein